MRITRLLFVGVVFVCTCRAAQINSCLPQPHKLPDDLRATFEARFAAFLTAQAQGHWDDVEELIGTGEIVRYRSYSRCLVSRMQELRLVSFDLSTPGLYTCSTTMDLPTETVDRVTAERLSWYVRGTGRFQTSSETWVEETQVRAYRYQGQWFFTPPQWAMQEKWEKAHHTEADFVRDRQEEFEIRNDPSSPLEIGDVHVHMDRRAPSLRNITFVLRNRTSKKITGLWMRIGDERGGVDISGPYTIKPKGHLAQEQSIPVEGDDSCEGVSQNAMTIEEVSFADGSKWKFKQSQPQ